MVQDSHSFSLTGPLGTLLDLPPDDGDTGERSERTTGEQGAQLEAISLHENRAGPSSSQSKEQKEAVEKFTTQKLARGATI